MKVRGFRIELGEIEMALSSHTEIQQAAVVVHSFSEDDTRLVGYIVVPQDGGPSTTELRDYLATVLPPQMLPQHIVRLQCLPLTPNGKLDRHALPAPDMGQITDSEGYVEPVTETQRELAAIWAALLRVSRIGQNDNFFDAGGHSMLAARMVSRARELMGVELTLRNVFRAQTLSDLAMYIDAGKISSSTPSLGDATQMEELDF